MKKIIRYKRYKIAYIHHSDILEIFNRQKKDVLRIFTLSGVPAGVKIINVWYDNVRTSFAYLLEHKSFRKVPEGEIPPAICPDIYEMELEIDNKKYDEIIEDNKELNHVFELQNKRLKELNKIWQKKTGNKYLPDLCELLKYFIDKEKK